MTTTIKKDIRQLSKEELEAVFAELRQAITHLRERGIRIVAPQVEDAQVAAGLWSTGVDYIQGNFVQQATQDLEFDFNASAL